MTETARNQPYYWQLPVYVEMGLIGLMGICFLAVPETPWFYGRRNNKEACFKTMRRLYGKVVDYDYEEEWGIIVRSIEHERVLLAQSSAASWTSIFTGTNRVSPPQSFHRTQLMSVRNGCLYSYLFVQDNK